MTLHEVNDELDRVSQRIVLKTAELITAEEKHLMAKATYDFTLNGARLEAKTLDPKMTQTDVNATASQAAHNARLEAISAECTYKRLIRELAAQRDRQEALREISFNLRKEAAL